MVPPEIGAEIISRALKLKMPERRVFAGIYNGIKIHHAQRDRGLSPVRARFLTVRPQKKENCVGGVLVQIADLFHSGGIYV